MDELYKISGVVIHGDGRGKPLGFPTANVMLLRKIPEGIYASTVTLNGKSYQAASFVGSAKTFKKTDVKLESYIFNFDQDIYGKSVVVRLYKKIRGNKIFDSVEKLVAQMKNDVEEINVFFEKEMPTR
jgi:riboflavin kinase / FMN adenylyltransferase